MQSSGSSWAATESATTPGSAPARSRFALSARSVTLDPRIAAVRRDLADIRLADRVFAPHYAVAARRSVGRLANVLASPGGECLSQVLAGEPFDVLEFTSTHAWGYSPIDGAVGFVDVDALVESFDVSHVVVVRRAAVHAGPAGESATLIHLPMGTRVAATVSDSEWAEVDGGYVHRSSIEPLDDPRCDPVDVAARLKGVAEIRGGRSGDGVDPAGLIFLAHALTNDRPARFTDLQAAAIGIPLAEGDVARRGDLIFFEDHVVMLIDETAAIHADGVVRCDPVDSLDRFGPVIARRRPA